MFPSCLRTGSNSTDVGQQAAAYKLRVSTDRFSQEPNPCSALWCTAALCSQHYLICLLAPEQIASQGMGRKQMTANSSVLTELCWAQAGKADLRADSSTQSEDAEMLQQGIALCLEHLMIRIFAFHLLKSFLTLYNYKIHSSNIHFLHTHYCDLYKEIQLPHTKPMASCNAIQRSSTRKSRSPREPTPEEFCTALQLVPTVLLPLGWQYTKFSILKAGNYPWEN